MALEKNQQPSSVTYSSYNHLLKVTLNICISSFYYGYGVVYFNSINFDHISEIYSLQEYDRSSTMGYLTGMVSMTGGFGAYLSGYLLQRLSRRQCFEYLALFSIVIGIILQVPHIAFLFIGRLLQGFCIGMMSAITPLYLREFSPIQVSGSLCPFNQIGMIFGLICCFSLAYFLHMFIAVQVYWRIVFGFPVILASIQLYNLKFNYPYQTPKYLILKKKHSQARELLKIIYKQEYVESLFQNLLKADNQKQKISEVELIQFNQEKNQFEEKLFDQKKALPKNPPLAVFAAFHLVIVKQMVGMGALVCYTGEITRKLIPSLQRVAPIVFSIVAIVGCFGSIPAVEYLGRKKNLSYGAFLVSICLLALFSILHSMDYQSLQGISLFKSYLALLLILLVRTIFSVSAGPITWLYITEIVQPNIVSLATMVNWFGMAVVSAVFPIFTAYMGGNPAYVFFIFGCYNFLGFFINELVLIETAGKNEIEIRKQFSQKW